MASPNWYTQFEFRVWLSDPQVSALSPLARGIWFDAICAMLSQGAFQLTGDVGALARICRCSPSEMSSTLAELRTTAVAEVSERRDGESVTVTILSRRLQRDVTLSQNERNSNKYRQKRHRESKRNGNVTPMSRQSNGTYSESYSESESKQEKTKPPIPPKGGGEVDPPGFAEFWDLWPKHFRKVQRAKCVAHWTANGLGKMPGEIAHCLGAWKTSEQWAKDRGQFIPAPIVWLRNRPWEAAAPPAAESGGELPPRNESAYERAKRQLSERENAA